MSDAIEQGEEPKVCALSTKELVDRCLTFVEEFTRGTRVGNSGLYTYQKQFARRIIESAISNDGDTITALFSRQAGKTQTVADVAVALCVILPVLCREFPEDPRLKPFSAGFWVGIFAPVQDQSAISFSRMRNTATSSSGQAFMDDPEIKVKLTTVRGDELGWDTGSVVRAKSASPDTQIEGKTYHLIICDEAQKLLRSKVEKEISPMLAATNGTMVKIGTAWESRGGFHTDIQFNVEEYKRGGKRNHYEFDYKVVISEKRAAFARDNNPFHLNYEKYVEKQIRKLGGVDGEEFKMNFRLIWSESRVIAIKSSVLMSGRNYDLELNRGSHLGLQVAGLDVAKSNDSTILTVMHVDTEHPIVDVSRFGTPHDHQGRKEGEDEQNVFYMKTIIGLLELQGAFEGMEGQYQRVMNFLAMFNISYLLVDATGMGDPVYERFTVLLPDLEVQPFKYSTPTKSDLYKYYLQEWNAKRIKYAAGKESQKTYEFSRFETQHMDLDRQANGIYIVCQAPEGEHDDYPDSGALAAFAERAVKKETMPEVESMAYGMPTRRVDGGVRQSYTANELRNLERANGRSVRYMRGR